MPRTTPPLLLGRRQFLHTVVGVSAAAGLAACATRAHASGPALASTDPLPKSVPPGTQLTIASALGSTKIGIQLAGLQDKIPFKVPQWPNIGAGPDVINAFRARSLELANNAGLPPIQSHFQGLDARIVAINITRKPSYVFATRPHSDIRDAAGFRGKKFAFSQGQAQGAVILRALREAHLEYKDVKLVPLTSDQFLTALEAGQVDIAPLGIQQATQYLDKFGKDGAHQITTDVVDLLSILWAPGTVLAKPDKAAAIAAFIPIWAQGLVWTYEHPDEWIQKYYVANQGISEKQARGIVALSNKPLFPPSWNEAISWEQDTINLLSEGGFIKKFGADVLFDRRFESLAADAVPAQYRS